MNEEDANLQSLFSDLNQVSRGTIIRERAGGGTGGGSEIVEGSMDPNSLMIGNPYIAKNVVGFNQGGVLGGQAMSNPYLDKVNQLVGLQQMVNVGKGMMGKALMEEAVTDSLMAPPIAKHGMKRKYDNGGKSFLNAIKSAQDRVMATDIKKGFVPSNWREQISRRGGYEAFINSGQPLTSNMKDQYGSVRASHGMKRKYVSGGVYNEGGVAEDEEVVSKDTRLQDLLDKLRSKSTIFGQIAPPRQSLAERTRPLHEMWEKVRAGEIPASTMFNLTNYRPPVERDPLNPFGSTILGTTMQLPYWQELIDKRRAALEQQETPIANKGMKMKKRYTQGGRF